MSDGLAPANKPTFVEKVDAQKGHPLAWKKVVKNGVVVGIAGVAIYLVFPSITEVLASWPRLSTLQPVWFALAIAFEVGHFVCTFGLQRLALRTKAWFPVVTSQLASNAVSLIVPGGAAMGAAVQFRMLAVSGLDTGTTVGGLAAFSLLGVGGLLALPLFALPVIVVGGPTTSRGLVNAAILGAVGFVVFAGFGALVLVTDAPLRWAGRFVQRVRNLVLRKRPPLRDLDKTLVDQRNLIRDVLGTQWWRAVLLSAGRLALDYLCLLAALPRHRESPPAELDPGGLRGSRHHRADSHHPRRPGHRRGEPDRALGAGRRLLEQRRAGHPHLPARLLLGSSGRRPARLRGVQTPLSRTPAEPR